MGKAIDITGQRFNRLVAIKPTEERSGKHIKWLFKCDCGTEKTISRKSVIAGDTKSCGCLSKNGTTRIDITNQKYGLLTAISPTSIRRKSDGSVKWLFQCDCGNKKELFISDVRHNGAASCGCLRKEKGKERRLDISNQKYGRLTAIEPTNEQGSSGEVKWLFQCDCGNKHIASINLVRQGNTKSCGCLYEENRMSFAERHRLDIANQRFGRLTAIKSTNERNSSGGVKWLFKCDCGNTKVTTASSVVTGRTKSCGCLYKKQNGEKIPKVKKQDALDITNQKFGRLTAVMSVTKSNGSTWLFRCDCGNTKVINSGSVRNGLTKSCGCLVKEMLKEMRKEYEKSTAIDITNQKYGRLTAIKPTNERSGSNIKWLFKCDCGNEKIISANSVRSGGTKSCGCLVKERNKRKAHSQGATSA